MNSDRDNKDEELLDISSDKELVRVADEVAFDILHPDIDNNKRLLFLLLLFIIFLTSIVSFMCFSMADRFNSIKNNTITLTFVFNYLSFQKYTF